MAQSKMEIEIDGYKKNNKRRKSVKALVIILIVLVVMLIGVGIYFWSSISQIWGDLGFDEDDVIDENETDPEAANLPEVTFSQGDIPVGNKPEGVIDILLLGVDNRGSKFTGRSDVMMYLRIDKNKNTIKLVSFMRDTLVEIDGHGKNKLNTAYHFGKGFELAGKTFKQNFGLEPDHYMVVNFYGMEDIINALDGVDIEIDKNEVSYVNGSVDEINVLDKDYNSPHIKGSGMQTLNGRQAVAYMRIRKVGGDAARTGRQQTVLNALFKKVKGVELGQITGLIDVLSQYVRTDIPLGTMMDIATTLKSSQGSEIQTLRYPDEYENGRYDGKAIVQPKDFEAEIKKLYDFLQN